MQNYHIVTTQAVPHRRTAAVAKKHWQHQLKVDYHYLLYPNPWPKPRDLHKRWHGHPIFKALCKISKTIILRSNWLIYCQEFAEACHTVSYAKPEIITYQAQEPLTLFEKKYWTHGVTTYQLTAHVESTS